MNIIDCCIRSLVLDSLQDLDESQHPGIQRLDTSMFTDDQIQDLFEQNASIAFYMTGMLWYSVIFWFLLALQLVGAMFSVAIFSASGEHRDHKGIIFAGHPRPKCPGTFSNCPTFGESLVSKSNIVFVLSFKIHPKIGYDMIGSMEDFDRLWWMTWNSHATEPTCHFSATVELPNSFSELDLNGWKSWPWWWSGSKSSIRMVAEHFKWSSSFKDSWRFAGRPVGWVKRRLVASKEGHCAMPFIPVLQDEIQK